MTQSITYSNFKVYLDNQGEEDNPYVEKKDNARYVFTLPQPVLLAGNDDHKIVLGVESASIPLSFYAINDTNENFYIEGTLVQLDHGNYNVANFVSHLNTKIQASFADITATFNTIDSKITFTSSDPSRTDIFFNNSPNSSRRLLGIETGVVHNLPYTCEDSINLTYTTGVTIRCNNIQTINQDTSFDSAGANSLLRIPINTAPNTVLTHFNPTPFLTTISTKTLTHLDIGLYDDNQRLLRIKDHAWFIVVRIDFVLSTDYFLDKTRIQSLREEANNIEPNTDEDREETIQINPLRHGADNLVLQEYYIPPLQEEEPDNKK